MRRRRQNNRTILVSFSGIDGAGKSTQIQALWSRLRQDGLRVQLIRFWDDVARLRRVRETTGHAVFKGDKGVGSPSAPINRRDKNVQSAFMTAVRLLLYFVDGVSMRLVVKKALRSGADFVIFDRYTYDELANLNLQNPIIRAYARMLMTFVPRPHISFFLDADPFQARARKPEYPLEFLLINRQTYLKLANLVGGVTVIGSLPVQEVERQVIEHARRQLPRRKVEEHGAIVPDGLSGEGAEMDRQTTPTAAS
jgi:thymidylate kinase